MSYPYPPMGPGQQPPGGQPGGWGNPPPPGGYGPPPPGGYGPPPAGGYGPSPVSGWQPEAIPGGPMGGPPMGGGPMGGPPPKGNGGVIAVVIAAAILLVVGTIGGAYLVAGGSDHSSPKASSSPLAGSSRSTGTNTDVPASSTGENKPGYYNSMKSWSLWNSLDTATQDSRPLTLSEVFDDEAAKSEKDTLDGTYFNLQGAGRLDTDCLGAVWGSSLKAAMQTYGCTQVVRAPYVSADQKWTGQLAIFNLKDVSSANALLNDLDPKAGKGFLVPVTGPSPIDRFGKGSTGAESGAYGHFVVVGWAGHADGSSGNTLGTDTIAPASTVQEAGKEFLFHRN